MAANDQEEVDAYRASWTVVQRHQCRDCASRCVNCGEPLHALHRVPCASADIARHAGRLTEGAQ